MKAAFRMWNNTRMIILVAVCSAIYGAALIAFKTIVPLFRAITEVRVASVFPMVFSLLFGPAGPGALPSATSSGTSSAAPSAPGLYQALLETLSSVTFPIPCGLPSSPASEYRENGSRQTGKAGPIMF